MLLGCVMLFLSLSFDGATGAYEDKIMQRDHVGPLSSCSTFSSARLSSRSYRW